MPYRKIQKVLPPEKVAEPERKARFVQEARAASALNHPNIVTIHDIASYEEGEFIVMEYIPGKSLSDVIMDREFRLSDILKWAAHFAVLLSHCLFGSLAADGKSFVTSVRVYRSDLWILEGFPQPGRGRR